MNQNRSAVDTIKGYFYQFDYSIKRLLELARNNDIISIERIEDVDIKTATDETAVQCKYYSKTEYNHSIIANSVRLMLTHFMNFRQTDRIPVKYLLYGYYNGGQDKLSLPLSLDDLKNNFLIYKKDKIEHQHHKELMASDADLHDFISLLSININAQDYHVQLNEIIEQLKNEFNCSDFEANHYYYNNALKVIKQLSIAQDEHSRTITKKSFISQINSKSILFNKWFIEFKGRQKYYSELRKEYFTQINISPFDRFFLVEIDKQKYHRSELKDLILLIAKKWSKTSQREQKPYCPFIYVEGIEDMELRDLKIELQSESFIFIDGFDFLGALFNIKSILKQPNHNNGILLKFLNEKSFIDTVLSQSLSTKEIYQFYLKSPYYQNDSNGLKHVKIQVDELKSIKDII